MFNKNEVVKLAEDIYQIKYYWLGMADVYAYLILGKDRGLLIDSCYSTTNISNYVRAVTDLPIDVVNTHGHFDHIGGNSEFGQVFLAENDWQTAKQHSDYEYLKSMMDNFLKMNPDLKLLLSNPTYKKELEDSICIPQSEYKALPKCGDFDLGERKVTFIETPGHTVGSICLFDEISKFFFVGDMACEEGVLLCFEHSTGVTEYRDSIRKMKKFYEEQDGKKILPAHHQCPANEDIFDRYISVCTDILDGKLVGEYQDQGIWQGNVVRKETLQIVYKNL